MVLSAIMNKVMVLLELTSQNAQLKLLSLPPNIVDRFQS